MNMKKLLLPMLSMILVSLLLSFVDSSEGGGGVPSCDGPCKKETDWTCVVTYNVTNTTSDLLICTNSKKND